MGREGAAFISRTPLPASAAGRRGPKARGGTGFRGRGGQSHLWGLLPSATGSNTPPTFHVRKATQKPSEHHACVLGPLPSPLRALLQPILTTTDSHAHSTSEEAEAESTSHCCPEAELGFQRDTPSALKSFGRPPNRCLWAHKQRENVPEMQLLGPQQLRVEALILGSCHFLRNFSVLSRVLFTTVLCSRC